MSKITVIEENQPSERCKNAFAKIAARSLLRRLGVEECRLLLREYYKSKEKKA